MESSFSQFIVSCQRLVDDSSAYIYRYMGSTILPIQNGLLKKFAYKYKIKYVVNLKRRLFITKIIPLVEKFLS